MDVAHVGLMHHDSYGCKFKGFCAIYPLSGKFKMELARVATRLVLNLVSIPLVTD